MPPVPGHTKSSLDRTGKDYKEVHEWLDLDPENKVDRHDITKIHEYGTMIEQKYGVEARQEYIRHLHDDMKAKFNHLQHDFEEQITDTLAYFGIK
jgi:hypothetical protein